LAANHAAEQQRGREALKGKAVLTIAVLAVAGAVMATGAAGAGSGAETTVTIKAPGGEVFGTVKSPKPERCAAGRKVTGWRVKGGSPGGGDDIKFGTDTAQANGGGYQWNLGNPGQTGKKIYAKVAKIAGCQGDRSKVIVAG
jgi:hypothetical protein